ncbi:hypothetical protein P8452_19569 [Trifolium repens]|nr:hypothetical protein P8452_19569 [Trifolium repens]
MTNLFPKFICCVKPYNFQPSQQNDFSLKISRRNFGLIFSSGELIFSTKNANAFEFGLVAPDQTVEEAQNVVRVHAQDLLQVRDLLELESWKIAQKELRRSSALLKKDIYTIIQSKPGSERPQLRKLYSTLFNNVTRLDYAARDKDVAEVWQRYENIVMAVNDILSRI